MTLGVGYTRTSNLYEDGLVCSSLLDQGSGWGHVTWRSGESNLVEVCKALMWVHMTADVYFAEPDTEDLIGEAPHTAISWISSCWSLEQTGSMTCMQPLKFGDSRYRRGTGCQRSVQ